METDKKINFWKVFSAFCIAGAALILAYQISLAWTNPTQNPPGGSGIMSASEGNVGIGTTAPGAKLDVSGNIQSNGTLTMTADVAGYEITAPGIYTTTRIRNDGDLLVGYSAGAGGVAYFNGNVGIGTTVPNRKLEVGGLLTATSPKAGYLSTDNILLSSLDGGMYFGRVGIKENQLSLSNYGNTWAAKESSRNWNAIAMSSDGKIQTAGVTFGQIYVSTDYGNTWAAKESSRGWQGIAMSSDGKIQTAVVYAGQIYVSTDYGNTWAAKESSRNWYAIAMSSDGKIQTAVVYPGQIYVSTDYGNTWAAKGSVQSWRGIAMSSDGKIQVAVIESDYIYISTDYGNTWTAKGNGRQWRGIAMSSDGKIQTTGDNPGYIYVSTDYGNTWAAKGSVQSWQAFTISSDGKIQSAVANTGNIYISTDYGNTWTAKESSRNWNAIAMSSDGKIQTAVANSSQIYVSFADSYFAGGNVGIGTTAPGAKLEIKQTSDAATNGLRITRSSENTYYDVSVRSSFGNFSDTLVFNGTLNGDIVAFGRGGEAYFKGTVGIGTTTPGNLLTIQKDQVVNTLIEARNMNSDTAARAGLRLSTLSTNWDFLVRRNGGVLDIGNDSGIKLTADYSGNVGIGTTNPSPRAKLDVSGGAIKITKTYTSLPASTWSDIDSNTDYIGALYNVVVQQVTDGPNIRTYLVLFSGGYYGSTAAGVSSVAAGTANITASFQGVGSGGSGPFKLQINPSQNANVYVTKIVTY